MLPVFAAVPSAICICLHITIWYNKCFGYPYRNRLVANLAAPIGLSFCYAATFVLFLGPTVFFERLENPWPSFAWSILCILGTMIFFPSLRPSLCFSRLRAVAKEPSITEAIRSKSAAVPQQALPAIRVRRDRDHAIELRAACY